MRRLLTDAEVAACFVPASGCVGIAMGIFAYGITAAAVIRATESPLSETA